MEKERSQDKNLYMIDLSKWCLILWKRKFWISGIVLISVLAVIIFMSPIFITPKYKSTLSFYPYNIIPKSDETPAKQVMLWCKSNEMIDTITKKYAYAKRYNIHDNYRSLSKEYHKNINVKLDKFYGNVIVEVYDKDPQMAYTIAKDFPYLLNTIIINDVKKPYFLNLDAVNKGLKIKEKAIDSVMKLLISYGVDYEIILQTMQGMEVTKGYLGTNEGSRVVDKQALAKLKTNIEQKGPEVYAAQQLFFALVSQRNDLQAKHDALNVKILEEMEFLSIVSEPYLDTSKVYPHILRTAVVVGFLTLMAAMVFFLIVEIHFVKNFVKKVNGLPKNHSSKKA